MMDYVEEITKLNTAGKAMDRRIQALEDDVRDIRKLTDAVALTAQELSHVKAAVDEVKSDVKSLSGRSGKLLDKIVAAVACAIATGLVAAVLALVLKTG